MEKTVQIADYSGAGGYAKIDGEPDECPFCHNNISPRFLRADKGIGYPETLTATFACTNAKCRQLFFAYYSQLTHPGPAAYGVYFLEGVSLGTIKTPDFAEAISKISEKFVLIFKQAYIADQRGLDQVSGPGYRKSLEFLVKDYLVAKEPNNVEKILKMELSACILNGIDHPRIKEVARRAAWLGNDETHYLRIWTGKDVSDLVKLIDMTVKWIELVEDSEMLIAGMPDKKGSEKTN